MITHSFTHTPLLGTVVELRIEAPAEAADAADRAAVAEFKRLDAVFSTYREDSLLSRWRRGGSVARSSELIEVLAAAQRWYETSDGAFHPAAGALRRRWLAARDTGAAPSAEELSELASNVRQLPFRVTRGRVEQVADCSGVDLNAIAKGYIVDRAAAAAGAVRGVRSVMVNAGGDLRYKGPGGVTVGVEDPARPFDNAPPRWRVRVGEGGLATSGSARRGFRVGERWLGHVIDPRTGWPVEHTTSVTVLAQDAMTADALATVLGVLEPAEAIAFAAARGIACMVVEATGDVRLSPAWPT